jgi:predicted DNA-binding protein (MmcQ/YjbR family)
MAAKRFRGTVIEGHKESAVEVPPAIVEAWGEPKPLRAGRRGYEVRGKLNGEPMESVVVPRSRKFWLIVDSIDAGEDVQVSIDVKKPAPPRKVADPLPQLREICLALPDATEKLAWGEPTFRVKGRVFAMYSNHHHGDPHLSVWLNAEQGVQATLIASDPKHFYRPPYVGPGGWIGIRLDTGLDWKTVALFVERAHQLTAAKKKKR